MSTVGEKLSKLDKNIGEAAEWDKATLAATEADRLAAARAYAMQQMKLTAFGVLKVRPLPPPPPPPPKSPSHVIFMAYFVVVSDAFS